MKASVEATKLSPARSGPTMWSRRSELHCKGARTGNRPSPPTEGLLFQEMWSTQ